MALLQGLTLLLALMVGGGSAQIVPQGVSRTTDIAALAASTMVAGGNSINGTVAEAMVNSSNQTAIPSSKTNQTAAGDSPVDGGGHDAPLDAVATAAAAAASSSGTATTTTNATGEARGINRLNTSSPATTRLPTTNDSAAAGEGGSGPDAAMLTAGAKPSPSGKNTTTPAVSGPLPICQPMTTACLTRQVFPLLRTAHNITLDETVKDVSVINFCNDPCGFRYTERADAVLRGRCIGDVHREGSFSRNHTRHALRQLARKDGDDVNADDADEDDSSNPKEAFLKDRAGVALGCVSDQYGEICALKRGCRFWNSCCFPSWLALAMTGGFQPTNQFIEDLDEVCPGAPAFLKRGACL